MNSATNNLRSILRTLNGERKYFDFEIYNSNISMKFFFFDSEKYFRLIVSVKGVEYSNTISEYKDYEELRRFLISATMKFEGNRLVKVLNSVSNINSMNEMIALISV